MPTSWKTIDLAFKLFTLFTGKEIRDSNLYQFVEKYGDTSYEDFIYGQPNFTRKKYFREFAYDNPYAGVIEFHFGFVEKDYLINYFSNCFDVPNNLSDKQLAGDTYFNDSTDTMKTFLDSHPCVYSFVRKLTDSGIFIRVEDLFKPLHIRSLFQRIYNDINYHYEDE